MEEKEYTRSLFHLLHKLEDSSFLKSYWQGVKTSESKSSWLSTWEATFHRLNESTERNEILEEILLLSAEALFLLHDMDNLLGAVPTVYPHWELIGVQDV